MKIEPDLVLSRVKVNDGLYPIAKIALDFIRAGSHTVKFVPGVGQSSNSVARMYRVRRGLSKFKAESFIGLEETIACLNSRHELLHLLTIETQQGVVSVWLPTVSAAPVGIVIGKFDHAD